MHAANPPGPQNPEGHRTAFLQPGQSAAVLHKGRILLVPEATLVRPVSPRERVQAALAAERARPGRRPTLEPVPAAPRAGVSAKGGCDNQVGIRDEGR